MTTNEVEAAAHAMDGTEDLSEEEIDRLWIEEALRRDAEFDAGTARARDAEDAFRDARSRFS